MTCPKCNREVDLALPHAILYGISHHIPCILEAIKARKGAI